MKYEVGDRVRIKNIDWYNENKDEDGDVSCREYDFVYPMTKFCGKILTIDNVFEDETYLMKEDNDGFVFTNEMIECKVEDNMSLDKAGQISDFEYEGLAYTLPDGYQFVDENGNEILTSKIILKKKKKEYPKTYEECLNVLGYEDIATHCIFHNEADEKLFNTLYDLKVCRDAYWKIAGDEMGLGKPWKPDWSNKNELKYCIENRYDKGIHYDVLVHTQKIFAFPTEEMRDAFKENFDPDIEICKEFL